LVAASASLRSREPRLGVLHVLLVALELRLERIDLRPERLDLGLVRQRHGRVLAELGGELAERRLLVGECQSGFVRSRRLDGKLLLGGANLLLERLLARLHRHQGGALLAQLMLEQHDRLGLLAELAQMPGRARLELLDAHLQPPRRHGELGAQLVLVGLDLRHRQRGCGFEPPGGEPRRAIVHQRDDDEPQQARAQEPNPEIHDRFDQERLRSA
jgi:hypothetical protein